MNSLETFTNQLIQHGTDLGAKLLSALVVLVIGLWLCRWAPATSWTPACTRF